MKKKQNVIKLQSPFEKIKQHGAIPEVNLYRAVIMQLIIDASNVSTDTELVRDAQHAEKLLFGEGDDLAILCEEAQLLKSDVVKLARDLIKSHKSEHGSASSR